MKILITGGHATPALAVIDKLMAPPYRDGIDIVYVGRKYSLDSEKTYSLEYKEATARRIRFQSLMAGRMTRVLSFRSIKNMLKVPFGFIQAAHILGQEKPDVILSFGGYIALPVAIMGKLMGIPVYTHEQTIRPGLTNRMIALFSRKFFYSFPEAKEFVKHAKVVFTGNPVRAAVFEVRSRPFEIPPGKRVVYITGGSLGSHSINEHIKAILPDLLKEYAVIHQIGSVKEYNDYDRLLRARRSLPDELKNSYFPVEHFYDEQIGYVYERADLVVGRSGANTFFELVHLGKPAILIPLPWSAHKEQQKHAEFFVEHGIGEIFEQREKSEILLEKIRSMMGRLNVYRANFQKLPFQIKRDASDIIIKEILEGR